MRDVTIVQGREDAKEVRDIRNRDNPPIENAASLPMGAGRVQMPDPPRSYNQTMRAVAADLIDLQTGIIADEGVAADHSIAATSGC
jgi:hypothetical protein